MYGMLDKFLHDGSADKLAQYDFKNESPWEDVRNERDPIIKFQKYKAHNKTDANKFDCDNSNGTCALSNEIYYALWQWQYKSRFSLQLPLSSLFGTNWERFGSDTMNSFQTTYNQAVKIYGNSKEANSNRALQRFASLTHAIGNFVLVPFKLSLNDEKSFNQYRGANFGKYFVYDYFDLSLKLIKETVEESVFKSYIDTFYLNDYVDENYNILPLLSRHKVFLQQEKMDMSNPEKFLPQNEDELNEYLNNINYLIKTRGSRLVEKLKSLGSITELKTNSIEQSKRTKKEPSKFIKTLKRWLILFIVCIVVVTIPLLYSIMSDIFSYISFRDAVNAYGLYPVLVAVSEEFIFKDFILSALSLGILLLLVIKLIKFCIVRFANKCLRRCQTCRRLFAVSRIKTSIDRQENIAILVRVKDRDVDGTITGTREQYIPGTRTIYKDTYQCKYCGCTHTHYRSVDKKSV